MEAACPVSPGGGKGRRNGYWSGTSTNAGLFRLYVGGYTQKAIIGGHKLYLRTGEYEDGTLGEILPRHALLEARPSAA